MCLVLRRTGGFIFARKQFQSVHVLHCIPLQEVIWYILRSELGSSILDGYYWADCHVSFFRVDVSQICLLNFAHLE